jgi:hypothetical protein
VPWVRILVCAVDSDTGVCREFGWILVFAMGSDTDVYHGFGY